MIPSNVQSIGSYAFSGCKSITKVIINNSVKNIGRDCFLECINLKEITFPDDETFTSIPFECCYRCTSLTNVNISENIKTIENGAFENTGLSDINLSHITSIGSLAFYLTNLNNINFSNSLTFIADRAFERCKVCRKCYDSC